MDWVYPAHVSCPVARTLDHDVVYRNGTKAVARCEAGHICIENTDNAIRSFIVAVSDDSTADGEYVPDHFMGVVLDNVAADPGEKPMVTTQLRGVTNVRLHSDAIKALTAIARQNGEVYGKYLCIHSVTKGNLRQFVASITDDRTVAIGFVHTYHCDSRFAEMEIFPRYSDDDARGTTTSFFGAASGFVEQGEFVHARPADKAVLNAATGFVRAVEETEGRDNLAVPLGNLMATSKSAHHMPRKSLGATVTPSEGGQATVATGPHDGARAAQRSRSARKRKHE